MTYFEPVNDHVVAAEILDGCQRQKYHHHRHRHDEPHFGDDWNQMSVPSASIVQAAHHNLALKISTRVAG
jgi:hypothetical protein